MTYDATTLKIHGFNPLHVLGYYPTRHYFQRCCRMGLKEDAIQIACMEIHTHGEKALTTKAPHWYVSGYVSKALEKLVTSHTRFNDVSLNTSCRRYDQVDFSHTVADRQGDDVWYGEVVDPESDLPRSTFDPFDLIECPSDRELVRGYLAGKGHGKGRLIRDLARGAGLSNYAARKRIRRAIERAKKQASGTKCSDHQGPGAICEGSLSAA